MRITLKMAEAKVLRAAERWVEFEDKGSIADLERLARLQHALVCAVDGMQAARRGAAERKARAK